MLIGIPPIFVADTKIIYGNNFVAPLSKTTMSYLKFDNTKRSLYPIGKNASKLKTG